MPGAAADVTAWPEFHNGVAAGEMQPLACQLVGIMQPCNVSFEKRKTKRKQKEKLHLAVRTVQAPHGAELLCGS